MSSLVLFTTGRWLMPPMLVGAFWILLRGHDSLGGGFAGGLVALAAYMLDAFAAGAEATRARLRLEVEGASVEPVATRRPSSKARGGSGLLARDRRVTPLGGMHRQRKARHFRRAPLDPESLLGVGLVLALVSASFGPIHRDPWMKAHWVDASFAGLEIALGTPLLFDLGVFLVVIGSGLALLLPPLSGY